MSIEEIVLGLAAEKNRGEIIETIKQRVEEIIKAGFRHWFQVILETSLSTS